MTFNFLKEWTGTVGGLAIKQTATPMRDGEELHVITGWHVKPFVYFNHGSSIPFSDVEKLRDDAFRLELARTHMAGRAKELREAADLTEAALAAPSSPSIKQEK